MLRVPRRMSRNRQSRFTHGVSRVHLGDDEPERSNAVGVNHVYQRLLMHHTAEVWQTGSLELSNPGNQLLPHSYNDI